MSSHGGTLESGDTATYFPLMSKLERTRLESTMPPKKKPAASTGNNAHHPRPRNRRASISNRPARHDDSKPLPKTNAKRPTTDHGDVDELLEHENPPPRKRVKVAPGNWTHVDDGDGDLLSSDPLQAQSSENKDSWLAGFEKSVAKMSEETRALVQQFKQKSADHDKHLYTTLSQVYPSPRPRESLIREGKARPALYMDGSHTMERCRRLLETYEETNELLKSEKPDVNRHQWVHDAERMSEMLEQGMQFGKELVDSMMQPVLEPQLPDVDVEKAKETDFMAIEMFDGVERLMHDTWGRTARAHLDAFEALLSKAVSR